MFRVLIAGRCVLLLLLAVSSTGTTQMNSPDLNHLANMRQHIDSTLYHLPLEPQGQYALMLCRTKGNKDYLETARVTLYLSAPCSKKIR